MNRSKVCVALFIFCLLSLLGNHCQAQLSPTAPLQYISAYQDFDTSGGSVDHFSLPDVEKSWAKARTRIERRAAERGANIALLRLSGNVSRGYNAQVRLFRADSALLLSMRPDTGCAIVVFRDHGPSLAVYRYDIVVDEIKYRDFKDGFFLRRQLDSCGGEHLMQINRASLILPVEGHSRYFRLMKGGARRAPKHAYVRFGGYTLQEIGDETLGRMLSEAHTEHLIAP